MAVGWAVTLECDLVAPKVLTLAGLLAAKSVVWLVVSWVGWMVV